MAVMTPLGSRPMERSFGSALHNVVFEPADSQIGQLVDYVIREAATRHCRHVVVEDVLVQVISQNVKILIRFSLADDRSSQDRPIMISKSDVINLLAASNRA